MQEKPGPVDAPRDVAGAACDVVHRISGWRRWSGHGVRLTFWCVLTLTLLFLAAVAVARFWLIPNADNFRPRVVAELSRLTGQRVVIDGFEAGWNGWSPELKLTKLQVLDKRGRTLLQLPEVDTTISWRSLIFFEPRLSALTVRAPRVVVRRTSQNALTVAGIDVDLAAQSEGDPGIIDWLLKQRLVQISGGELEWQDDWRKLPSVRLRNVNIRLQNNGSHHRFGMTAEPPPSLAAPIDVRSEFTGSDVRKISDWDGLAYLRADYANLQELTRYVPVPIEFSRGEGGLQAWFEFDDGQPIAVTTDLLVKNARLRLPSSETHSPIGANAPAKALTNPAAAGGAAALQSMLEPLDLATLSGRLSWRSKSMGTSTRGSDKVARTQQRWSVRDVNAVTQSGLRAPLVSGEVLLDFEGDQVGGGSVKLSALDLAGAVALVRSLPLSAEVANKVAALQPRGMVQNLDVKWSDKGAGRSGDRYEVDGSVELSGVAWKEAAGVPGVSGLSAQIKGSNRGGEIRLGAATSPAPGDRKDARENKEAVAAIDFGSHFEAPLAFTTLRGNIDWKRSVGADGVPVTTLDTAGIDFENADAAGKFIGSWQSDKLGPGVANITGTLRRASTTAIYRYLPTSTSSHTRNWLRQAVLGGEAQDAKFILKGPLWHFPFRNDEHGVFEVDSQVTGGILDYADNWPRAENINTRLKFRGARMDALVAGATIAAVPISATEVKIADMGANSPLLEIRGGAAGPLDAFLRWSVASPVNGWLDGFLQTARGTGPARLTLALSMPLDTPDKTKVQGELQFTGNRVDLGGDIPPLDNVNGRLRFSEADVRVSDLAAETLGGPLKLNVSTENGRIRALASGTAAFERVRERYPYPLLDQLAGATQWQLDLTQPTRATPAPAGANAATGAVEASLLITASTVQARWPLDSVFQVSATPRDPTVPIQATIKRNLLDRGRDRIEFELPGQLHAILERSAASGNTAARTVERATLDIGTQKTELPRRGYALRGDVLKLDADAGIALLVPASAKGGKSVGGLNSESSSADFVNINLRAAEAVLYANMFHDVTLRAQPVGQRWRLALRSKEATGAIALDTDPDSGAIDAVSVRLQRFSLPATVVAPTAGSATVTTAGTNEQRWPKLELVADSFVSDGRDLGKLEVRAQPQRDEWRIEQVKLSNADGSIEAKGRWQPRGSNGTVGNTAVDVALSWKDAGKFMNRFGLPKGVERGEGTLSGALQWTGSPAQFSYAKLGGKFTLQTSGGRFTEMEPGIAKLLGVLSLQSLPRRLSFNFDDLFGRGFAFDEIRAEVAIADGMAKTDGFAINGPSARVQIRGTADINRETQDLQVRVYPSLSTATAIGIGLVTANPAIGAAALLGQKIARDPIERMLMQEFEVKGTWTNPDAKPPARPGDAPDAAKAASAATAATPRNE